MRFRNVRRMVVLVGLLAAGPLGQGALLNAAPPASAPTIRLADLPDAQLSAAGWSGTQTEGQATYRAAKAGAMRTFQVKAWWDKDSLRPAEGEILTAQVRYRDTATRPIEFAAHSGLLRAGELSPLHRFGGSGDGQWKTADVPVSWDYLARLVDTWDMTEFGVQSDVDLPVAAISFRRSEPGDVERFNAQTRAWVAASQKRSASTQAEAATTQVEAAARARVRFLIPLSNPPTGMVPFACPVLLPLMQGDQPGDDQVSAPVRIRLCQNQIEDGSFGVYALADQKAVTVTVRQPRGEAGELSAELTVRAAEYSLAPNAKGEMVRFPTRLWPAFAMDIPKGLSQWFVLNVRTIRDKSKPGKYVGSIEIASATSRASLPLEVEVLPIDLLTMEEAGLSMGGCTTGLPPMHDVAFQVGYNQNGGNLWASGVRPAMTLKDGQLQMDWRYIDDWMKGARRRGMVNGVWFLGGNPYGFPRTMALQRELYKLVHPAKTDEEGDAAFIAAQAAEANRGLLLPEVRPLYVQWVKKMAEHARASGWPEVIVSPLDEPAKWAQKPGNTGGAKPSPGVIGTGPWIKTYFEDCCAAIKEGDAKTRIYASIHNNRTEKNEGFIFLPVIDVFCAGYSITESPWMAEKVKATPGKAFWQYWGGRNPVPASGRYAFGWWFASLDSRGSLCWAYSWTSGMDAVGSNNWAYAWQTPFDTIPSPYFEAMRQAWDDRRIIETYRKRFAKDPDAMGMLNQLLAEAADFGAPKGRPAADGIWLNPDNVRRLDQWRNRLLDRMVQGTTGAAGKP